MKEFYALHPAAGYATKLFHQLAVGDVITLYGVALRLTVRREYRDGMVTFKTEYVSGETELLGRFGVLMRDGKWSIQTEARKVSIDQQEA
jgi:hypothetical protein